MIFGKRGIRFRDAHAKKATALMDEISRQAIPMARQEISMAIQQAYRQALPASMDVLEGAWQALNLKVPEARDRSATANDWKTRCRALIILSKDYETT